MRPSQSLELLHVHQKVPEIGVLQVKVPWWSQKIMQRHSAWLLAVVGCDGGGVPTAAALLESLESWQEGALWLSSADDILLSIAPCGLGLQ